MRVGPPQNWGWLFQPPVGCDNGPLSLEIRNQTGYYLTVMFDGKELDIRGGDDLFPHVPPGESVYICMDEIGPHHIAGTAFIARTGQLQEIERFSVNPKFGLRRLVGWSRRANRKWQVYKVTENILARH